MMKICKILPLALLAGCLFLQGCNDDDDTTKSYLSGALSLRFPQYVEPGFSKTFYIDTMMTMSRSDSGIVGYYFKDPVSGEYDTLYTAQGEFVKHYYTVTVPDTLDNLTLTFGAFAESDYYGTSTTATFTVVKPGLDGNGSITNFAIEPDDQSFVDERDGTEYYYTTVDGIDWMRQNLSWAGSGHSYYDCDAMSLIFGRYYTWEEAVEACPPGWRLPSDAEVVALGERFGTEASGQSDIKDVAGDMMEDLYFNGTKMWEYWREVKITNDARLSVMPVGYATVNDGELDFDGLYYYAAFWTSDTSGDRGAFRYIYQDKDVLYYGLTSRTDIAASVRCVREATP